MNRATLVTVFALVGGLLVGCSAGDEAGEEEASSAESALGSGCWVKLHGCEVGNGMACSSNGKCADGELDRICDQLIAKTCGIPWPPNASAEAPLME
jgi:hypothetical protein